MAAPGPKAKRTVQSRWVDATTGELVIEQDWGAAKPFTARYKRVGSEL